MTTAIFAGRTALVTGGSRGIVRMLAEHGAKVAINYQCNAAAAQAILAQVEACGTEGMAVQADVAQQTEVERMVAQVRTAFGPVELLVNNAGIAATQEHGEFGFAELRSTSTGRRGRDDRTALWADRQYPLAGCLAPQGKHDPLRYD